jgi:hypothetical protein
MAKHKKEVYTTRGGTNMACVHCGVDIPAIRKKTNRVTGEVTNHNDLWHYTDKEGMKAAWNLHKDND